MKLKTEKKEFSSVGAESKQFSVDTSDTMVIRLLRDKMYKNKIGAVAREIASNSRDANREAGRGETPITICIGEEQGGLLSDNTLSISFKDNGIGISPERMDNIFLKYGSSTKRDTDEFTGGFGIGAKTPFAYSDNFFITTIVENNGVRTKYYYQAVITSNGTKEVSRMLVLGEETTNEQTGTEIIVPIKNDEDRAKFEKEVLYATSLWNIKPTLIGFVGKIEIELLHSTEDFLLIKDIDGVYGNNTKYVALIDGIPYSVDSDKIKTNSLYTNNSKFKWFLKFDTSDITVSGSREDIEYIEENIIKINNRISEVCKKGEVEVNKFLNDVSSYKEACLHSIALSSTNSFSYRSSFNVELINKKYTQNLVKFFGEIANANQMNDDDIFTKYNGLKRLRKPSFRTLEIKRYVLTNGRMKSGSLWGDFGSDDWNLPAYYMDLAKAEPTRNAMLKKLHPDGYLLFSKKSIDSIYFNSSVTGTQKSFTYEQWSKEDEKNIELFELSMTKYSEVEKLRKEKNGKRNVTDVVNVNFRVRNDQNHWDKSWTSSEVKYDKGNKEFIDLINISITNAKLSANHVNKLAYFVKDKLSEFNENSSTRWGGVAGMNEAENSVRKILLSYGILVIGVSSSKEQYFKDAKINTMEDEFSKLLKRKEGEVVSDIVKLKVIESGNFISPIYSKIDLDKNTKKAIEDLTKFSTKIKSLTQTNSKYKSVNVILDNLNETYVKMLNIKLGSVFEKKIGLISNCNNENPMVKLIAEIQNSKTSHSQISKNTGNFMKAVEDYVNKFNK